MQSNADNIELSLSEINKVIAAPNDPHAGLELKNAIKNYLKKNQLLSEDHKEFNEIIEKLAYLVSARALFQLLPKKEGRVKKTEEGPAEQENKSKAKEDKNQDPTKITIGLSGLLVTGQTYFEIQIEALEAKLNLINFLIKHYDSEIPTQKIYHDGQSIDIDLKEMHEFINNRNDNVEQSDEQLKKLTEEFLKTKVQNTDPERLSTAADTLCLLYRKHEKKLTYLSKLSAEKGPVETALKNSQSLFNQNGKVLEKLEQSIKNETLFNSDSVINEIVRPHLQSSKPSTDQFKPSLPTLGR